MNKKKGINKKNTKWLFYLIAFIILALLIYIKVNEYNSLVSIKENTLNAQGTEKIVKEINNPSVTMMFGGDIMLDRGVRKSVIKNFDNNYEKFLVNLKPIFQQNDIVFANLEGSASDKGKDLHNLYSFRMDPAVVPALKNTKITILSVANNHVGDWGRDAYIDSLARLKISGILYTGGGDTEEKAAQPTIIDKNGIKIGFLGFSDKGPSWMAATDIKTGLLLADNPNFDEIIQTAAKQVDYLIVSFHFGEEYKTIHNARQEYLAHKAIDDGAKIIIGSHPHVIEDTENYKKGFIAYSLGNLIFDQYFSKNTMQGMLLGVTLFKDGKMTISKNIVQLNKKFQPETITIDKNEETKS